MEIGWLKTLVAFANTEGGALFIGVEDKTHKVVALEQKEADRIVLMIHRQIRERCMEKKDELSASFVCVRIVTHSLAAFETPVGTVWYCYAYINIRNLITDLNFGGILRF